MQQKLFQFIGWLAKSFSGTEDVSSRRLTAFAITCCYIGSTIKYNATVTDPYYLLLGIGVHALFVLLLFRLVSMKEITDFKNGNAFKSEKSTEITVKEKTEETTA